MKKRGISGVITAVILILLVLVMTAVIWVVVRNLVTEELDDATAGISRVDLEVKKVTINPQVNTLSVRVKRNIGKGNLSKVKFILSDGKNTESQDIPTTMGELDEQTFNVSYSLPVLVDISIAPILLTSSGRETLRDTTTIHQFTTKEKLSFIQGGPVSWWRLDGNANDEIGNNDGTVLGGLSYINSGRFGKAASFDGIDDYIQVQDSPELQLTQNFAIVTWINPKDTNPHTIICKGLNAGTPNYILNSVSNQIDFYNGTAFISSNTGVITQNDWNHVAFVHDGTSYTFYVSGVEQGTGPIGTISASTNKTIIGEQCNVPPNTLTGQFNGTIDELMIFNSALTPEEIETLHTIDLS